MRSKVTCKSLLQSLIAHSIIIRHNFNSCGGNWYKNLIIPLLVMNSIIMLNAPACAPESFDFSTSFSLFAEGAVHA